MAPIDPSDMSSSRQSHPELRTYWKPLEKAAKFRLRSEFRHGKLRCSGGKHLFSYSINVSVIVRKSNRFEDGDKEAVQVVANCTPFIGAYSRFAGLIAVF